MAAGEMLMCLVSDYATLSPIDILKIGNNFRLKSVTGFYYLPTL
jgi:hypothetical protein